MKKILYLFILVSFYSFSQQTVDLNNSSVKWTGKAITGKSHFGTLSFKSANLTIKKGNSVEGGFIVDMTSLSVDDLTGKGKKSLEGHLMSDDFFSVDKFNEANLEILGSKAETSSDGMSGRYIVDGNLTIKGITNPVTFEISLYKENTYRATLVFDRSKFDVRYGSDSFFDNLGDRVILNEIELVVDLVIM